MNYEKFSLILCTYMNDDKTHLKEAISSIINQSKIPNEYIVIVDGPINAESERMLLTYENEMENFHIYWLPENVGHGRARQYGLDKCSYDLVALMDADDISERDRFEKQLLVFYKEDALSIVGSNILEFIGSPDNVVSRRVVQQTDEKIKQDLKKRCPFNQVTVMFRKSDVEKAGGYVDWYNEEDYYLWIRMYQNNAKFYNINEDLVHVRVGKEMYKRRGGSKYFYSEVRLQRYLYKSSIISFKEYLGNVLKRFVIQVMLPNTLRSIVFKKFAREEI